MKQIVYPALATFIVMLLLAGFVRADTASYYFDGSDAAASDLQGVWTNDANAFDGDTGTNASTATGGDTTENHLKAEGTNAPTTGNTITQVRARIFQATGVGVPIAATIYTDNEDEGLGSPAVATSNDWGDYTTLSAPTGGWTWQKVNDLEVKIYKSVGGGANTAVAKVEIEVTSSAPASAEISHKTGTIQVLNGTIKVL